MDYLKIRNWDKWQTYRSDRGRPPWIKVHRCLLRDHEWVDLTDAERGQLVSIWLLAADRDGVIPASPELIQKLCFLSKRPDINRLISLGFIEGDAIVTPSGCQGDVPEKLREVKLREENPCVHSHTDDNHSQQSKENPVESFERFWTEYPKKRERKKAYEIWKRKKLDGKAADELIADTRDRLEHDEQWKKGFIPNPTTYLNGHRWEDDYGR